jgi:pullulanase/glycogen debranching enzyme
VLLLLHRCCPAGDVWHIALPGCDPGLLYGYRVSGPNQDKAKTTEAAAAAAGHKFDDVRLVTVVASAAAAR